MKQFETCFNCKKIYDFNKGDIAPCEYCGEYYCLNCSIISEFIFACKECYSKNEEGKNNE